MKQCPVCKTTYTDKLQRFCLNDGNILSEFEEYEQPTVVAQNRNPARIGVSQNEAGQLSAPLPEIREKKKNFLPLVLAGLFVLVILAGIGIGAAFLIKYNGNDKTTAANNSVDSNSKSKIVSENKNDSLEGKIADLERRLKEQSNQRKTNSNQIFPDSSSNSTTNQPTAKVKQSGDGFLALRSEPNVKTGAELAKIPSGAIVQLENCEKDFETINGRRGRWCMISYKGETGWSFDAWLAY